MAGLFSHSILFKMALMVHVLYMLDLHGLLLNDFLQETEFTLGVAQD